MEKLVWVESVSCGGCGKRWKSDNVENISFSFETFRKTCWNKTILIRSVLFFSRRFSNNMSGISISVYPANAKPQKRLEIQREKEEISTFSVFILMQDSCFLRYYVWMYGCIRRNEFPKHQQVENDFSHFPCVVFRLFLSASYISLSVLQEGVRRKENW